MKLLIFLICGCIIAPLCLASSDLVFVVDESDTVLPEIKLQVPTFFDELSKDGKTQIGNYTLVIISSSMKKPITNTDVDSFKSALDNQIAPNIRRGPKPTCHGKSLTAIKSGLSLAASKSVLIVFTDAVPDDKQQLSDIKKTIAATHSKVIFFLINGTNCKDPRSNEYEEIALASNGQIFEVTSNNLNHIAEILNEIRPSIGSQRVDLLAADEESKMKQGKKFTIPMSDIFSEVLITISANKNFNFSVTSPNKGKPDCQKLDSQAICRIEKPLTGNYSINVGNTLAYAVRVSATSDLTFQYGFQTFDSKDSAKAKRFFSQPMKGANNTFIVKFDNPSTVKLLSSVEMMYVNGAEKNANFTLYPALNNTDMNSSTYGLYYTSFKVPESNIHLKIIGTTNDDKPFQVITPVALYPSSENEQDNILNKDLPNVAWDELTREKATNSSNLNSSSVFMTSFALLFFVVKKIYNN